MVWWSLAFAGVQTETGVETGMTLAREGDATLGLRFAARGSWFGFEAAGGAAASWATDRRVGYGSALAVFTPFRGSLGWDGVNRQNIPIVLHAGFGATAAVVNQPQFGLAGAGLVVTGHRTKVQLAPQWAIGPRIRWGRFATGLRAQGSHWLQDKPSYDGGTNPQKGVRSRYEALLTVSWILDPL